MCIFVDVANLLQRVSLFGSQKCLGRNGASSQAKDTGDNVRHVSFYVTPMYVSCMKLELVAALNVCGSVQRVKKTFCELLERLLTQPGRNVSLQT